MGILPQSRHDGRGLPLYLFAVIAPSALPEQLPVRIYTTADGLAHTHINCIRQDSRGVIVYRHGIPINPGAGQFHIEKEVLASARG